MCVCVCVCVCVCAHARARTCVCCGGRRGGGGGGGASCSYSFDFLQISWSSILVLPTFITPPLSHDFTVWFVQYYSISPPPPPPPPCPSPFLPLFINVLCLQFSLEQVHSPFTAALVSDCSWWYFEVLLLSLYFHSLPSRMYVCAHCSYTPTPLRPYSYTITYLCACMRVQVCVIICDEILVNKSC